ncbi:MAG: tRNA (adenosine(37)-N6)-threonylcarbamoyltransferase complex transferase subunit TsaD [Dehalococcoidia bacterium]|nr:tRNA (adenosine(37)-N6)-threonylcarbamoyltransferase complex transferase subunit TsaD [Dehalococcoidia bacterium]
MLVLGIETSCDETAVSVVEDGRRIRSDIIASQADLHAHFGGIVPELASRHHLEAMLPVLERSLAEAEVAWQDIDLLAVTAGPGLAGALLVGVNSARALSFAWDVPLLGVNHLEAHVYANWLDSSTEHAGPAALPAVCLIVSGAHSDLAVMGEDGSFQRLGRTLDDAAGEAFDKVARLLGLGFPGGPAIQRAAAELGAGAAPESLPRAWLEGDHNFSFSGLKTEMLKRTRGRTLSPQDVRTLSAGFQESVADVLSAKTARAAQSLNARTVLLSGGVAANSRLRALLAERSPAPLRVPPIPLCTDNAAMVGAAGFHRWQAGDRSDLALEIDPGLPLGVRPAISRLHAVEQPNPNR